ncbi:F-box/LRR-repeat protein 12-like [Rutidosis leptorrhynchoides]|uniref:F-box/LRR-repeat protein 12-like n=1 Tax=Rutidosis leptorrhynchoides TaxID=125765 RepID=UPI003A998AFF
MDVDGKEQGSCITSIPDEVLYLIFKKLDKRCDRESFGLTCLRFLEIQNESRKSWTYSVPDGISVIDKSIVDKLLNRFRNLESLSLSMLFDASDKSVTPLQRYGSKLHSLSLPAFCHFTDIGFSSIASGCPLLSIFSLHNCSSFGDSGLEILSRSCKLLKEVSLGWCSRITDIGMLSLTQHCRQLRSLRITACHNIHGLGFKGCSPTLTCLDADECGFDSTGYNNIFSGGGLEYLNLSIPCRYPMRDAFAMIGLGLAANLKILDLALCSFVRDDDIKIISKGCPLLQEWNLSHCYEIQLSGWESIGLYCKNLERLHLCCCESLCDLGLLAIGNGCKRLSILYMSECSKITSSGIESLKRQREDLVI